MEAGAGIEPLPLKPLILKDLQFRDSVFVSHQCIPFPALLSSHQPLRGNLRFPALMDSMLLLCYLERLDLYLLLVSRLCAVRLSDNAPNDDSFIL
jgi:hypothetical protein